MASHQQIRAVLPDVDTNGEGLGYLPAFRALGCMMKMTLFPPSKAIIWFERTSSGGIVCRICVQHTVFVY